MAVAVFKGLGKLAIGAGAVYVSWEQGIWSGSTQGANSLHNLTSTYMYNISNKQEYIQQMPSARGISQQLLEGWNSGVKCTFRYIAAAPEKVGELTSSTTSWLVDSVNGSTK